MWIQIRTKFIRHYFFVLSVLILLLGLLAFSDNLITDVYQHSNSQPVFIIHGLLMFIWIFVLIIQTNQIRKLNFKAHMRFGRWGFIAGIFMILSILYLHWLAGTTWYEVPYFAKANRIFVPTFAVMLLFAYLNRNRAIIHKYLIFSGMLLLMEPILSRATANTGIAGLPWIPVIWIGLWASLFLFDLLYRKKVHPIIFGSFLYVLLVYYLVT